ncbi:hypothetical protein [Undibacterium flavidum]|uniref:hypothetical protein n=1 Tax=Undibacterium flavidum TaxID=2762297 RepID=UPI001C9AC892|nr:hypothetical protein [Undibacterium flavidum]
MFTKKILQLATLALLGGASTIATAGTDFTQLKNLNQSEFGRLASDFTSAASYKGVTPAAALGITGFDLGAELSFTPLANSGVWQKAGADISTLIIPKLHLHKGLPFNIDVGASLSAVPDSNIKLMGIEARYSLLEGNVALPAIAIRGAYSKLSGVSQLGFDSSSVELLVSKGFVMFTPYAGIGRVWGSVTPNVGSLHKVSPTASKVFAGVNANFGLMNLAAEVDRTGDNQTASVKLGFRW